MSDYFYDYEYDTTYCYPQANVLKNKLNIKDADSLLEAERSITALRILELKQSYPDGKLDFSYFKHLHFYICYRKILTHRCFHACKQHQLYQI